jgi:hypothetical protein
MEHASALRAWESFYVIVGSSAAALTGLQFVVIALISDLRRRSTEREISAFATPTVVHFTAVLMLSGAAAGGLWRVIRLGARALAIGNGAAVRDRGCDDDAPGDRDS